MTPGKNPYSSHNFQLDNTPSFMILYSNYKPKINIWPIHKSFEKYKSGLDYYSEKT